MTKPSRDLQFLDQQLISKRPTKPDREYLAKVSHSKHAAHHKGRPHFHAYQQRQRLKAMKTEADRRAVENLRQHHDHVDRVRAYWRGEGDHP